MPRKQKPSSTMTTIDLRDRFKWKAVEAPRTWRPTMIGEELIGFYGGKTLRSGKFGQYEVVIVHVPNRGTLMVSGTVIIQLVDAAQINVGWPIRIIWRGEKPLPRKNEDEEDRTLKVFEVMIAEGDPLAPEVLPQIVQQGNA